MNQNPPKSNRLKYIVAATSLVVIVLIGLFLVNRFRSNSSTKDSKNNADTALNQTKEVDNQVSDSDFNELDLSDESLGLTDSTTTSSGKSVDKVYVDDLLKQLDSVQTNTNGNTDFSDNDLSDSSVGL